VVSVVAAGSTVRLRAFCVDARGGSLSRDSNQVPTALFVTCLFGHGQDGQVVAVGACVPAADSSNHSWQAEPVGDEAG
jgi:hypothetical protein